MPVPLREYEHIAAIHDYFQHTVCFQQVLKMSKMVKNIDTVREAEKVL